MSARLPSWQGVAAQLANRLIHHARCQAHPPAEADPGNCPWCADRAAYQLYLAKAGLVDVPPPPAQTISLTELAARTEGPAQMADPGPDGTP